MLEPDSGFPNKRLIHSNKVVYLDLTFVLFFFFLILTSYKMLAINVEDTFRKRHNVSGR